MKKIATILTSALLCMTMLVLAPAQVVASAAGDEKKYISEVKVGMGEDSETASKSLLDEGYTILKDDNGNYADLNKNAGSKSAFKEGPNQKIVYLGYKTTADADDAITDLAVMNMNGGFSYEEYEKLMNDHMDTQIKPFVNRFIATLKEYRENLQKPQNTANFKRANYYKTLLNKLTDDDTGGQPLGDLLVNQTKYEMSDEAYNALSDEEKKNHCDILTLLMQGNGQAVQLMETELTKSADSSDSTWLDRFKETGLDKLTQAVKDENPNMTPSEINQELDKQYNDDARKILDKWTEFNDILLNYDTAVDSVEEVKKSASETKKDIKIDKNSTEEEVVEFVGQTYKAEATMVKGGMAAEDIAVHTYLENENYGDGTMLEFFEKDKSEFDDKNNIRQLYPIVDSLTGGQLAGLDFLSIKDMILMAVTDENGFKEVDLKDVQSASIYQDVNREIYEKGGVALTDAAMRAKATAQEAKKTFELSKTGIVLWSCTAAAGLAAAGSALAWRKVASNLPDRTHLEELRAAQKSALNELNTYGKTGEMTPEGYRILDDVRIDELNAKFDKADKALEEYQDQFAEVERQFSVKSNVCKYLAAGFSLIGAILAGLSIYTTIKEYIDFYKVTFAPVPKYIVERSDITATNAKGQEVMIKNQTAYYKVVLCNRTAGDSSVEKKNYEILQDRNDLNGDVGTQWLALYSVKYENGTPILADSLKLKMGEGGAPEGYETGIHKFGEKAAFNLTYPLYCYNDPYNGTYIYFKNDTSTVKDLTAAGSTFSSGSIAIGAVAGLLAGSAVTLLLLRVTSKKKKEETA